MNNKSKHPVVTDERIKLLELTAIKNALIITFTVTVIISLLVISYTKKLTDILWPLGIFIFFVLVLSVYERNYEEGIEPYTIASKFFTSHLPTVEKKKRYLIYMFDALILVASIFLLNVIAIELIKIQGLKMWFPLTYILLFFFEFFMYSRHYEKKIADYNELLKNEE